MRTSAGSRLGAARGRAVAMATLLQQRRNCTAVHGALFFLCTSDLSLFSFRVVPQVYRRRSTLPSVPASPPALCF